MNPLTVPQLALSSHGKTGPTFSKGATKKAKQNQNSGCMTDRNAGRYEVLPLEPLR
jgi:hypothetical protein